MEASDHVDDRRLRLEQLFDEFLHGDDATRRSAAELVRALDPGRLAPPGRRNPAVTVVERMREAIDRRT